jgi:hypothetical protein
MSASPTRANGRHALRGLVASDREHRQLLLEVPALALRALEHRALAHQQFELMLAIPTAILVQWHGGMIAQPRAFRIRTLGDLRFVHRFTGFTGSKPATETQRHSSGLRS